MFSDGLLPDNFTWQWKQFNELTLDELYAVLKLRQDVFVIEQTCCYEDLDNADQTATHLLVQDAARSLVAYQRVFEPGLRYDEASIGRIIVAESARSAGLGGEVVRQGIAHCRERFPNSGIRIEAQAHLGKFYGRHGFESVSDDPYDVDGIPHIDMVYRGA